MRITAQLILATLVVVCLAPFLGKAFHVDDTLFVWTGRQIAAHPADPYGFEVTWYTIPQPMSEVTQNPPLAGYYLALAGVLFGWSEFALHAAFLLPAIGLILGTWALARSLTTRPMLAALATLASPAFLASSTTVMCDTMMAAFWVAALLCWVNGMERKHAASLACSGLLMAACALTKYSGMALIPLVLAYSLIRRRRFGTWVAYLFMPVAALIAYEYWSKAAYGMGLLSMAFRYSSSLHPRDLSGSFYAVLTGLTFAGACALPALTLAPLVWRRRWLLAGLAAGVLIVLPWTAGMLELPTSTQIVPGYWPYLNLQMAMFAAGGIAVLALAAADCRKRPSAESALLLLWVLGTFAFAVFLNWTVNARSLLPMMPAVAILLARRCETKPITGADRHAAKLVAALAVSAAVASWVAWADTSLANSARTAARFFRDRYAQSAPKVKFEGHWGFQYYMQAFGFAPLDTSEFNPVDGDVLVIPHDNTNSAVESIPPRYVESQETAEFRANVGVSTVNRHLGAGFYSDIWGPLPFAFGRMEPQRYTLLRLHGRETQPVAPGPGKLPAN